MREHQSMRPTQSADDVNELGRGMAPFGQPPGAQGAADEVGRGSLSLARSTKAVFLDRDGVLNEALVRNGKPFSPMTIAEVAVPPDVPSALSRLRQHGFRLIMVTNQPNIARRAQPREAVYAINRYLLETLQLQAVEMCEHDDADNCDCRKPKPGMLLRAAERDHIALAESFMIGDRWRDIEAGRRAGCRTILIGNGYGEGLKSTPDAVVATLTDAADWILRNQDSERTI
jgi:D-glycero-D-manno-heptose 1,7-bisphosphate phosphatase